jgi:cytochrome c-type biogenesis protein CcmH/NrfG
MCAQPFARWARVLEVARNRDAWRARIETRSRKLMAGGKPDEAMALLSDRRT